jgi:hypothetical protein
LSIEKVREELKEMERAMFGSKFFNSKRPCPMEDEDWGKLIEAARPRKADKRQADQEQDVMMEMEVEAPRPAADNAAMVDATATKGEEEWQVVWSDTANRPFYFIPKMLVGTFTPPPRERQ